MRFDYSFRTAEDLRDVRRLIDFLANQDLGYPRYDEWVQKAEAELFSGWKTGIMALNGGVVVGDLVFQQHKQLSRVREIKNLRVDPRVSDRYFARFMLKQAEVGLGRDFDLVMVDARKDQSGVRRFFRQSGYSEVAVLNLYDNSSLDVVLTKEAA